MKTQPSVWAPASCPHCQQSSLLTTLHDDATCLKSFSHLTTCEMLSRTPWWLAQSGKLRNVTSEQPEPVTGPICSLLAF